MSKLYLYSIFHGNLNYSSIPHESYQEIINKCYWPVLDILKDFKFKTGIEFPLATIKKIENIDPLFITELKKNLLKKKCEIICSGQEQVVFPLTPFVVNKLNLQNGKNEIEKKFGIKCKTAYINEQQFSVGLLPLYYEENFKNIITMLSENNVSSKFKNEYYPSQIFYKKKWLNIIWNSFTTYKKFQKYINGKIKLYDYLNFIQSHIKKTDSCYPFYGSDMEIFGYKNPILGINGDGKETERFRRLLEEIDKCPDLEFLLPSNIIEKFKPLKLIKDYSKFAILEKNPNVSIVRWATCGRDNSKNNSICYQLLKKIQILYLVNHKLSKKNYMSKLIDCWASDYRTHTTESKYHYFNKLTHSLNESLEKDLSNLKLQVSKKNNDDLIIFNPTNNDWENIPYELKLHFLPSKFFNFGLYVNGKEIPFQIEDIIFYKDKSIQSATLVFEPFISRKSTISISVIPKNESPHATLEPSDCITTKNVKLLLLKKKGSSISELTFPKIDKNPLIGTLSKNFFREKPSLNYSSYILAVNRNNEKLTDLVETNPLYVNEKNTIRKRIICNIDLLFGNLTKIYHIYENHPRVDIRYIFNFKEYRPATFRIGIFTLLPQYFNRKFLSYSTHNGGELESWLLNKDAIIQDETFEKELTKSSCMGSTEGWIDIGDNEKGITFFSDKSLWYSVPMINFKLRRKNFFFNISNSVSDIDDTTMTWWKGRKEISFTLLGRSKNYKQNHKICQSLSLGLVCVSKNKSIKIEQ